MSRKIEFDYDRAIAKATRIFWANGYSHASMRDLLKAMRIGEGSFYNTVKSKKRLYLECLKHYNATVGRKRLTALAATPTAGEGIRAFFKTVLDDLEAPKTPRLCLLSGSLADDVLEVSDLRQYVIAEMELFTGCFVQRLEAARISGEVAENFDVVGSAQLIVTYLTGLFRTIRTLHDRAQVEKQLEILLSGLGL